MAQIARAQSAPEGGEIQSMRSSPPCRAARHCTASRGVL